MVTTLFLVRHGETVGSEIKRYKGSIDVPLSENGIEQIKRTSAFISNAVRKLAGSEERKSGRAEEGKHQDAASVLSAVYCSPLSRALKSAEIIAAPHQLAPVAISDLRERSFGIWEGMTFNEIRDKYPAEFEAWAGNPLIYSPMEGENTVEVKDRVIGALNKILDNHQSQYKDNFRASELPSLRTNIAIVAHGGVNRVILCHVLGIPLENIFRIEQDNASVNIIEFWDNYPVVKLLNGVLGG